MKTQGGFTLLELIVAAGILALIAVFSWRGLDALVREREALATSQASIDVLQRSFARIERDALLAGDVEVDERGMRLVAGSSAVDGATSTNVEYRLADGALTRTVAGADRAPLTMIEGIASLVMEAWAPTPRGGSWVRVKGPPPTAPVVVAPAAPGAPVVFGQGPQAAAPVPVPGQNNGPPQPEVVASPSASAATGIRLTIALAGGARIVRSFIVGGG